MPKRLHYPDYFVHWKTGQGELRSSFEQHTPIKGYTRETGFIRLHPNGRLFLREGFVWDFGSGPAVDTPAMVWASLAHDAFYELMKLELLPWSERKRVDRFLRQQLRAAGASWFRAWYVYWAVRLGYPLAKVFWKRESPDAARV